ncbi:glycosyltransferase family 4 protein [Candidatus Kaiserbacteria bacterium]|nr:glycosyltransferase family 4 protein [Candidatus Kaiserbacteria bacterium]
MRLLVCTQAVDRDDPVLGFFHQWLAEFARRAEHVHVICLKEGSHALPTNVSVHSLGKESGRSLFKYLLRFFSYVWRLRNEYDAVFVHMNEEYVLLGGLLWRMLGKRIVLWRNHKIGSFLTRIASSLAHVVCFTSPAAYVAGYKNAVRMPIGVDTDRFAPRGERARSSILFLGRLDAVKNPETFLQALTRLAEEQVRFSADVYGDPSEGREEYARRLKETYRNNPSIRFFPSVRNEETPPIYAAHDVYVNLTPSGSFDKTIGEAMASGCVAVVANDAVKVALGSGLLAPPNDRVRVADAIHKALSLTPDERRAIVKKQREYIEREHSLSLLVEKLGQLLHG